MRVIWKFPMLSSRHPILIPEEAEIINVGMQDGGICLWAIVDDSAEMEYRHLRAYYTGDELGADTEKYLGSCTLVSGIVWHIFEEISP